MLAFLTGGVEIKERHLNNLLIWGTANKREYPLILKFAFIGVHSRFEIWASYLIDNPKLGFCIGDDF